MSHQFDELAKALAEGVSRREALRRVGSLLSGGVLFAAGLGTAWGQGRGGGGGKGCPPGQTKCKGKCINTSTDPLNCGGCGSTCRSDQVCSGGACQCPTGKSECNGTCVDTASDRNNCGACGNVCTSDAACISGVCQGRVCDPACAEGFICSPIDTCCIPNGGIWPASTPGGCCSGFASSTDGGPTVCVGAGPGSICSFSGQCNSDRGLTCGNGRCCYGFGVRAEFEESLCCSGRFVPNAAGELFCA